MTGDDWVKVIVAIGSTATVIGTVIVGIMVQFQKTKIALLDQKVTDSANVSISNAAKLDDVHAQTQNIQSQIKATQ